MRILLPHAPIMAKDQNLGTYEVDRPMKTRKLFFALASVLYVGALLFLVSTKKT